MKLNKGFTLIELLVVISIIGLLSSVVLASVNTARSKARDSKRIQDLKQLQNAVELYRLQNNQYPPAAGWNGQVTSGTCALVGSGGWLQSNTANWIPGLAPTYIATLPIDPKPNDCNMYIYTSDGRSYKIMAHYTVEGGLVGGGRPFARIGPRCTGANLPDWWDGDGPGGDPDGGNSNDINDDPGQPVYAVYGGDDPNYECY